MTVNHTSRIVKLLLIAILINIVIKPVESSCNFNFGGIGNVYWSLSYKTNGGAVPSGNSLTMPWGLRGYVTNNSAQTTQCSNPPSFIPEDFLLINPLGATISATIDLSTVGCGCNAAFYLVTMPARNSGGGFISGSGDYYCDANYVGGTGCPELDLIEANTRALAITPHKCSAAGSNSWSGCDGGGCYSVGKLGNGNNNYGPGSTYTINSLLPFNMSWTFQGSAGSFTAMVTTVSQGSNVVTVTHNDGACGSGYLSTISSAFPLGWVFVGAHWGNGAGQMSWLDGNSCGSATCSANGNFVLTNLQMTGGSIVPYSGPASPVPTSTSTGASSSTGTSTPVPTTCSNNYVSGACSVYATGNDLSCPFKDISYFLTPAYANGYITEPSSSNWGALQFVCNPSVSSDNCITVSSSTVLHFEALAGSVGSSGSAQVVQVIPVYWSGSTYTTGPTYQVSINPGSWNSYTVQASSLSLSSNTPLDGLQFQYLSNGINQPQVLYRNIYFSGASCGQSQSTPSSSTSSTPSSSTSSSPSSTSSSSPSSSTSSNPSSSTSSSPSSSTSSSPSSSTSSNPSSTTSAPIGPSSDAQTIIINACLLMSLLFCLL